MYSRNSFGSYYPIDSTIHRLNPVIKLVNFIILILLLILCNSLIIHVFALLLLIIMILLSLVPYRYYFDTFWSLRYLYIIIAFLCLYFDKSLELCFVWLIKLVCVVEYLSLIAYTTSPSESAYGIEKFLSLFNFLFLPVSKFSFKSLILIYPSLVFTSGFAYLKSLPIFVQYLSSNLLNLV